MKPQYNLIIHSTAAHHCCDLAKTYTLDSSDSSCGHEVITFIGTTTVSILVHHGSVQHSYRFFQFWRIIIIMLPHLEI